MPRHTFLRAVVVWIAILPVAIANGSLRDFVLAGLVGPAAARFISGVLLCVAIFVAAWLSARWLGADAGGARWRVGALWLALTLGFEFTIGALQHQSLQQLLDAYTFQGGNLWPLVLLTTLIAPWAGARMRGVR